MYFIFNTDVCTTSGKTNSGLRKQIQANEEGLCENLALQHYK